LKTEDLKLAGEVFHKAGLYWTAVRAAAAALTPTGMTNGNGGMAHKQRFSFARSAKFLQESVTRSGPAAGASYTLIGAILLLGGIGYGVDTWRETAPWGLLLGLLLGIVVGFYELAKTVWHR
jgi:hypothetical protein